MAFVRLGYLSVVQTNVSNLLLQRHSGINRLESLSIFLANDNLASSPFFVFNQVQDDNREVVSMNQVAEMNLLRSARISTQYALDWLNTQDQPDL